MIGPGNPRALYFNDDAAVGWVRGAPVVEFAALDPRQGVVFYRLDQQASPRPRLQRSTECLRCHIAWETLAVPGMMVLSTGPDDAAGYATGGVVDHRDPIASRWGRWFVTGRSIPPQHFGTAVTQPPWAAAKSDLHGYPAVHSDVVALMVLEHQTHAANLLTYLGWEARVGASPARLDAIVQQVADYFLFVDEAPLPQRVEGSSGFAERFAAQGRGTIAGDPAPVRPPAPFDALSVQLHDLRPGFQGVAVGDQDQRLSTDVDDSRRIAHRSEVRAVLGSRTARRARNPAEHHR